MSLRPVIDFLLYQWLQVQVQALGRKLRMDGGRGLQLLAGRIGQHRACPCRARVGHACPGSLGHGPAR